MKKKQAFTLVELLVVISIIALLLAILVPGLGLARELARRVVCGNILRGFGQAQNTYVSTWNGYYVPIGVTGINIDTGQPETRMWPQNLDFRKFLNIDSYKDSEVQMGVATGQFFLPDPFVCPSDRNTKARLPEYFYQGVLVSFGYNLTDWSGNEVAWGGRWGNVGTVVGVKADQVRNAADKIMFTDSVGDWWIEWKGAHYENAWDKYTWSPNPVYKSQGGYHGHGCVAYRHQNGANVLFYDGHVDYMKKWDIFIVADWDANPKRPGRWSVFTRYTTGGGGDDGGSDNPFDD